MRLLGLDIGHSRIGIAISDETGTIAEPLTALKVGGSTEKALERIGALCSEHDVAALVVGMPFSLNGEDRGQSARMAREMGERLASRFGVEIVYWDERFSSIEAERALISGGVSRKKRQKLVDKVAASLILQSYLDRVTRDD